MLSASIPHDGFSGKRSDIDKVHLSIKLLMTSFLEWWLPVQPDSINEALWEILCRLL